MNKIVCETVGDTAGAGRYDGAEDVVTLLLLSVVWLFLLSLLGDMAATWDQNHATLLCGIAGLDTVLLGYVSLLIYKSWFVASIKSVFGKSQSH